MSKLFAIPSPFRDRSPKDLSLPRRNSLTSSQPDVSRRAKASGPARHQPSSEHQSRLSVCLRGRTRQADSPAAIVPARSKRHRSEEHTSELQSRLHLVCRLLLEKKNNYCLTPPTPTGCGAGPPYSLRV